MHNSDKQPSRNRKYIKRIIVSAAFLAAFILVNSVLDYMFIPYSYVELDYYNVYNNEYDTIYIGTSHGKCGIDPTVVDAKNGSNSFNMCLGGEYLSYSYYIAKDICRNYKPKKIVYELDPGYWITDEYIGTDSSLIFDNMKWSVVKAEFYADRLMKEDFRLTLFPWYVFRKEYRMISDNIKNKRDGVDREHRRDVFATSGQRYEDKGFIYRNPVSDSEKSWLNFEVWDRENVNSETLKYFIKLVSFCKEEGIELEVIITPAPDETVLQYSKEYKDCDDYFKELTDKYKVQYYNFNYTKLEGLDTTLNSYCDHEGHFNGESARIFSEKLADYVRLD